MEKEFIKVLLKTQKELPVVGRNTEAFKYKYAPLEHVWEKVGAIILENGFVISNQISTEGIQTSATHELGSISSFIPFSSISLKPQEKGSEITYARRYNLTAMFNIIVAGEDDDAFITKEAEVKVDVDKAKAKLNKARTLDELTKIYKAMIKEEQNNKEIIAYAKEIKENILTEQKNGNL